MKNKGYGEGTYNGGQFYEELKIINVSSISVCTKSCPLSLTCTENIPLIDNFCFRLYRYYSLIKNPASKSAREY